MSLAMKPESMDMRDMSTERRGMEAVRWTSREARPGARAAWT